jgi:hypothetical protein
MHQRQAAEQPYSSLDVSDRMSRHYRSTLAEVMHVLMYASRRKTAHISLAEYLGFFESCLQRCHLPLSRMQRPRQKEHLPLPVSLIILEHQASLRAPYSG